MASTATAPAQTIFDENFDGGYTGSFGTGSYSGGSPTGYTATAVLASGGNPNGCWQETMTATTGSDYYTGQVQLMTVSGNTDPNPSDYVLSFDAKGSQAANIQFIIQTWPGNYFGGTGQVINATINDQLTAANTWQTFSVNLGSLTTASPTGATWQLEFQINASQWGGAGHTDTLTIDNIILVHLARLPRYLVGQPFSLRRQRHLHRHGADQWGHRRQRHRHGGVFFCQRAVQHQHRSGGIATSSAITNLPVGTDVITAVYSGGNYPASTNTLYQIVNLRRARALRRPISRFTPTIWSMVSKIGVGRR